MKCANHPLTDSIAYCGQCGRALCAECKREVRGMVYCESCLATRLQSPLGSPVFGPGGGPSPGVALALSFIPGVGAAYNGQVLKGLFQLAIFISLWAFAERVDFVGWGVAAWWIYVAIDSYQTARRKQLGQPTEEWFGLGDSNVKLGAPVGAAILIAVGALFLLDNFGVPVFSNVAKFWPLLLIVVGLFLLLRRAGGGGMLRHSGSALPPPSQKDSGEVSGERRL